jgi:hypothetical protein
MAQLRFIDKVTERAHVPEDQAQLPSLLIKARRTHSRCRSTTSSTASPPKPWYWTDPTSARRSPSRTSAQRPSTNSPVASVGVASSRQRRCSPGTCRWCRSTRCVACRCCCTASGSAPDSQATAGRTRRPGRQRGLAARRAVARLQPRPQPHRGRVVPCQTQPRRRLRWPPRCHRPQPTQTHPVAPRPPDQLPHPPRGADPAVGCRFTYGTHPLFTGTACPQSAS